MSAVATHPMKLVGPWAGGYVLDYHTVSSIPTGDPYYRFDTKRTELGELLYHLKYRAGANPSVTEIVDTLGQFLGTWNPPIEVIVPSPPSLGRPTQPVVHIARSLSERLQIPAIEDALIKTKPTPQMKNIQDWFERRRLHAEAIQAGPADLRDKVVLLLDDLVESGSTLRRSAEVLLRDCGVKAVYALVLTRTK